jgi:hypothetical protein
VRAPGSGVRLARSRGPTAKTTTPPNDGTRRTIHRATTLIVRNLAQHLGLAEGDFRRQPQVLTETVRQACAQALVASPRQPATGGPLTAESTGREGR